MDQKEKNQISEFKTGNKQAFGQIFSEYYQPLCAYAHGFVQNLDDSEEIVQDVFYRMWEDRAKITIEFSLRSYLFRAVANRCLNHLKHRKVQRTYAEKLMDSPPEFTDSQKIEEEELRHRIALAIEKLPEGRRRVFELIRMEGKKYQEVADLLHISIKTVENQMGSAIQFLREELRDYLPLLILFSRHLYDIYFSQ